MSDTIQPLSSPDVPDPQPQATTSAAQSNDAALAGMMTMFRAFAALASQSPNVASSFATQANPPLAFPAFISTDQSSAGKSLPALFPAIETSLLLDIARHEFRPLDLCKLDPASKFRRADMERSDNGGSRVTGTKDYPALHNLLIPLSTYFSVLQAFAATSGNAHATFLIGHGAARYASHLMNLNQKYEWAAVLQYHVHFYLNRRQEMLAGSYAGWAKPDDLLLTEFCLGNARMPAASRKPAGKRDRDVSSETCFAFNKGTCTASPCPDGRVHKCRKCGGKEHGEKDCKKA
ncbi:hypothetical protein C0992_012133 [Termitomyces sp. T32_za158]|nr:hypothetical protein C0992_012133 [Termitomyces sp. T32_za158]